MRDRTPPRSPRKEVLSLTDGGARSRFGRKKTQILFAGKKEVAQGSSLGLELDVSDSRLQAMPGNPLDALRSPRCAEDI